MTIRSTANSFGSPPRMRGKALLKRNGVCKSRITPAHAGKSYPALQGSSEAGDHPRACGEKVDGGRNRSRQMGSPPRMRGKAQTERPPSTCLGITPAHAGKSQGIENGQNTPQDHPRACGEKSSTASILSRMLGSPPRMRGKVEVSRYAGSFAGITPAHAGKRAL